MGRYDIPRGDFERTLCRALSDAGFDPYATICDERLRRFVDCSGLSAEVQLVRIGDYEVMPFFWGSADAHPDVAQRPNFVDHRSNLEVWWDKYPLRAAEANRFVTIREWVGIVRGFADYVQGRLEELPPIR